MSVRLKNVHTTESHLQPCFTHYIATRAAASAIREKSRTTAQVGIHKSYDSLCFLFFSCPREALHENAFMYGQHVRLAVTAVQADKYRTLIPREFTYVHFPNDIRRIALL